MTGRLGLVFALAAAGCLGSAASAPAQPSAAPSPMPRLMIMDMPYARVWDGAVHALAGYAIARASDGVIETTRLERAPRPEEAGAERVAERVTVRVQAVGERIVRVTVTVAAEALRNGAWQAVDPSPETTRAILDRIRAGLG